MLSNSDISVKEIQSRELETKTKKSKILPASAKLPIPNLVSCSCAIHERMKT